MSESEQQTVEVLDLSEEDIRAFALDLANNRGSEGYRKMCKQWGTKPNRYGEKCFKAGFCTGGDLAVRTMLEASRERKAASE